MIWLPYTYNKTALKWRHQKKISLMSSGMFVLCWHVNTTEKRTKDKKKLFYIFPPNIVYFLNNFFLICALKPDRLKKNNFFTKLFPHFAVVYSLYDFLLSGTCSSPNTTHPIKSWVGSRSVCNLGPRALRPPWPSQIGRKTLHSELCTARLQFPQKLPLINVSV